MSQSEQRGLPIQGDRDGDKRRQTDRQREAERAGSLRGPGDELGSDSVDVEPTLCQLCSALRGKR